MKTRVSILFYAKKSKTNKEGLVPIYTRITVSGKRIELSTNRFIILNQWSKEGNCMKGNSIVANNINKYLDVLRLQIVDAQMELTHEKFLITVESLKYKLLGREIEKRMLIPIFEDHNKKVEALIGQEYALGTLERYKTSLKHTQEFLQWKYKTSDIDIKEIDHAFITDYEFWLRSVRKCANNTAVKYIKNFKKIIRLCMANGWLSQDPFINYKAKLNQVERAYLSEQEIQIIYKKIFVSDRLTQVRDIFLFCCYTGLAYIDVKNLTKLHISLGIDGDKWLFTHCQKTKMATRVPLLPLAEEIVNKYEKSPYCINNNILLPVASAKIPLSRMISPQLYWVMTGNDFSLDINNPKEPKILCVGNNPDRQNIYSAALGLYNSRIVKLINKKGQLKSSVIIDELPTIYFIGLDNLIATARSNKVAVCLGFQDFSQLTRDYGDKESKVIQNTVGNIFSGQVVGETAKSLSERFGKVLQKRQSITINRNDKSTSISTQLDSLIPASKISTLTQGIFVGAVSDNYNERIEQKMFHAEIVVDNEKVSSETKNYQKIPDIISLVNEEREDTMKQEIDAQYKKGCCGYH